MNVGRRRPTRSLAELEGIIERGLAEIDGALLEIRDGRLYWDTGHRTFKEYCQKRWALDRLRYSEHPGGPDDVDIEHWQQTVVQDT